MPKGIPNKRYTPEFKKLVVETMQKEKMSYRETARQFEISDTKRVAAWERLYPTEGPEGLAIERRGRGSKGRPPKQLPKEAEEDLLDRDFRADRPDQKWVTNATEFSLFGEKLYLSPVLDLHSSDLVSYTISERPVLSMVTARLDKAFEKIPDGTDRILHSDQGWQYQHKQYQQMLREKGIRQSMSRKGNCLDDAVIENFFGLLKSELLYLQEFHSMEHFKQELIEYLDHYNDRRIKAKLKGLPPAIHRQQALSAA